MARIFLAARDMDDELRGLFDQFAGGAFTGSTAGECTPPLDVLETADGLDVVVDVAGVAADSLQVVVVHNTLVILGDKRPAVCAHREAAFHLVERAFGRFARAVRLSGAFDAGSADARLRDGELRVTLPRIDERRGREFRIAVRTD
jgi:HSP20 family protein